MKSKSEALPLSGLRLLEDEDFVWSCVWPLVSGGAPRPPAFDVSIQRSERVDGRIVAAYAFGGSVRAYAKLYPDREVGREVYRIHEGLRAAGFDSTSPHRVPKAVAYLEEHGLLLLEPAPGERLGELPLTDWAAFEDGVLRSARWLAELHASRLALGPRDEIADGTLRLARRAEKATTLQPEFGELLKATVGELSERQGPLSGRNTPVQTHGRFHCAHVFVAPDSVTAVDLDRAALADPAADVGEFVATLSTIRRLGLVDDATVDAVCKQFVAEYVRYAPAVPYQLTYYWSYCIAWALVRLAFKDRPQRGHWRKRVDFLVHEFESAPTRVAAWVR